MVTNEETLRNTTDAVVKATGDDMPAGIRAVTFNFKTTGTDKPNCTVTFDLYNTESTLFANLNQMTSNAIASVLASGRQIKDFTTYLVR